MEDPMKLSVLTVPGCPNAEVLAERLAEAGVAREQVAWTTVTSAEQASELGMHGSPTLLVDGTDPFAEPGAPTGYACRLYPEPDGTADGAPSTQALTAILFGAHGDSLSTLTLDVAGMTCGKCQQAVEGAAGSEPGVSAARVDLAAGTATVTFTAPATPAAIRTAIEDTGYQVSAGAGA
jgi:copper chaperone CopZ